MDQSVGVRVTIMEVRKAPTDRETRMITARQPEGAHCAILADSDGTSSSSVATR